ncbi:MAG: hypothetical protein P1U40_12810 [Coxiellaceae bacterium]|nr:hypothetical protein [Coxiellaceae bacterium]
MKQPTGEQLHERLLNLPSRATGTPQIFYNFNRELIPSSSPGIMFVAGMLFSFSLATGLQDFYMPHFQNNSEPHAHSGVIAHLELPIIAAVFATTLSVTGYMLANQASAPAHKKELHKRNLMATGLGILPGALVGIMADLYSHRSHYDANPAAAFCAVGALTVLGFFAACIANCARPMPHSFSLTPRIGTRATGMRLPTIDEHPDKDLEDGTVHQFTPTTYKLQPPPRM